MLLDHGPRTPNDNVTVLHTMDNCTVMYQGSQKFALMHHVCFTLLKRCGSLLLPMLFDTRPTTGVQKLRIACNNSDSHQLQVVFAHEAKVDYNASSEEASNQYTSVELVYQC